MKSNSTLKVPTTVFLNNAFTKTTSWIWGCMLLTALFFSGVSVGQTVASYTFSESSGTYTAITGTTAIAAGWDDNVTGNTIPIGFTFNYAGNNYTTCSINSNGYITFGATLSANTLFAPISNNTGYARAISAVGVDLIDVNNRPITYTTTGTAPNRVFTVQWRQTRRFLLGGQFNFQIKLYESTNVISLVYGDCAPNGNSDNAINVQVGLRGASNVDFNNRSLTANDNLWDNNTTAGLVNTAACRTRSTNYPDRGLTFTWTPPQPCTTPTTQATALNLTPADVTIAGSFTAAAPAPNNYLVVISESATPFTPVDGTTYTAGQTVGAYTIVDVDANTTFTATGLLPETLYYIYVYSFNSLCSGGPLYNSASPLTGSTTTLPPSYCEPLSDDPDWTYINDIQFLGTLNDVSNLNSGFANGYQDFTGLPNAVQAQGEGINVFYQANRGSHIKAWVDWNQNGSFEDAGELVYDTDPYTTLSATFGFVIPPATPPGDYRIRIRNNTYAFYLGFPFFNWFDDIYDFDSCEDFPNLANEIFDGEAEDYLFTVIESCSANIATVTDGERCGPGVVNVSVTGTAGTTSFNWYDSETGGTLLANNAGTYSPNLATTTTFYVTAVNGCESLVRVPVVATINPLSSVIFSPASGEVCGELSTITVSASGDTEIVYLVDEDFEAGGLGLFQNVNAASNNPGLNAQTQWTNRTSTYVPTTNLVWFPAVSSGFGANRFAMSTSDVNSPGTVYHFLQLTTPVDATTISGLTLTFDMYYSNYADSADIQVNDGSGWAPVATYNASVGIGTRFAPQTIDLSSFDGAPNLRFRIRYLSNWGDGIAVDNIKLFGTQPIVPAFTWTSTPAVDAFIDAGFNTAYVPNTPASIVYIRPTLAQLSLNSFDISASVTLTNSCPISASVTFTNGTKIWNGTTNNWHNPNNWLPIGIPSDQNCVVIVDNGANPDPEVLGPPVPPTPSFARNLTIKNNGVLELQSGTSLTVTDWITVEPNGTFEIRDTATLVQLTDVATNLNIGNSNMYRRVTGINSQDYVYWSTPTEGSIVGDISPNANPNLIWQWQPTVGTNTNGYGEWTNAAGAMTIGEGYIVRGLSGTLTPSTARFRGRLNNGIINVPISKGSYIGADYTAAGTDATELDDNWNLVGNPYPSAIFADDFITTNAAIIDDETGSAPISGTIYLWTHVNAPSDLEDDPFYQDFVYNYNADDYISYNLTGPNPSTTVFSGYIAAGQSFFVLMDNDASVPVNANLQFNNSMRGDGSYRNDQFLRTSDENTPEKHRIWLDIINSNNKATSTLVGYIEGATNSRDRLFDGDDLSATNLKLYSIIDDKNMAIQGRSLPFDVNDMVPLGFNVPSNGTYTIAINNLDGLFESTNQAIYLEDLLTNTIHDLKANPYVFTSVSGTHNDRFILRYTNETLGIDNPDFNSGLNIISYNNEIKVTSTNNPINTIEVYDILGRTIVTYKDVNVTEFKFNLSNISNGTFIVKATLYNGQQKVKKIVH
uniref:Ig-like domain-containing protein n=1 Tax=Gelidibacter sp. TaxID=2018083 RepID=UPI00404A1DD0